MQQLNWASVSGHGKRQMKSNCALTHIRPLPPPYLIFPLKPYPACARPASTQPCLWQALPFLNALLLSLPVAIAPIWIAALPRPRFPSSACLSKKALPFFLSLFLSSRCVPPSPPNPFRSPCWYFSLCSSHFRLHSSLGNVDLFLTSSS
ncbi:hypothetical protein Q8A67_011989 [Cirrhinus molitorella]|uniref:Uncharacterized protein n=1 Tax=Cirrhinus molitorella TaxID=172907 RepID=A0AA88Q0G9_9TELE|nr:hypothetical protein Q8A67_011989 [Cirrhinus molitorella]